MTLVWVVGYLGANGRGVKIFSNIVHLLRFGYRGSAGTMKKSCFIYSGVLSPVLMTGFGDLIFSCLISEKSHILIPPILTAAAFEDCDLMATVSLCY